MMSIKSGAKVAIYLETQSRSPRFFIFYAEFCSFVIRSIQYNSAFSVHLTHTFRGFRLIGGLHLHRASQHLLHLYAELLHTLCTTARQSRVVYSAKIDKRYEMSGIRSKLNKRKQKRSKASSVSHYFRRHVPMINMTNHMIKSQMSRMYIYRYKVALVRLRHKDTIK